MMATSNYKTKGADSRLTFAPGVYFSQCGAHSGQPVHAVVAGDPPGTGPQGI